MSWVKDKGSMPQFKEGGKVGEKEVTQKPRERTPEPNPAHYLKEPIPVEDLPYALTPNQIKLKKYRQEKAKKAKMKEREKELAKEHREMYERARRKKKLKRKREKRRQAKDREEYLLGKD